MLVALCDGSRALAALAEKGPVYRCAGCMQEVILKKGSKVVHHFAHRPPMTCAYGAGETQAHMAAKMLLLEHFAAKGYQADVEYPIGEQRADVHVLSPKGASFVFEIQHSPISPEEIAKRTEGYYKSGSAVIWLPLIDMSALFDRLEPDTYSDYVVRRYSPKPFERWIQGYHGAAPVWFVDAGTGYLWACVMHDHIIEVPATEWGGGYDKVSKRWKELFISGPFNLDDLNFKHIGEQVRFTREHFYPRSMRISISEK